MRFPPENGFHTGKMGFPKRKMKTAKVQYSLTTGVNENLQFRTECLQVFRDILIKTTLDDRYKTDLEQSRISLLFSPFVGFVTRNFHQLNFNMLTDISGKPFKKSQDLFVFSN